MLIGAKTRNSPRWGSATVTGALVALIFLFAVGTGAPAAPLPDSAPRDVSASPTAIEDAYYREKLAAFEHEQSVAAREVREQHGIIYVALYFIVILTLFSIPAMAAFSRGNSAKVVLLTQFVWLPPILGLLPIEFAFFVESTPRQILVSHHTSWQALFAGMYLVGLLQRKISRWHVVISALILAVSSTAIYAVLMAMAKLASQGAGQ